MSFSSFSLLHTSVKARWISTDLVIVRSTTYLTNKLEILFKCEEETQQHNTFHCQTIPTQTWHYEQTELNQRKHLIYKLKRKIKKKLNKRKNEL
jgi:hypothetical protein